MGIANRDNDITTMRDDNLLEQEVEANKKVKRRERTKFVTKGAVSSHLLQKAVETFVIPKAVRNTFRVNAENGPIKLGSGGYVTIDHAFAFNTIAIVSGWFTADTDLIISSLIKLHSIRRTDADKAINRETMGFVAVISIQPGDPSTVIKVIDQSDGYDLEISVPFSEDKIKVDSVLKELAPSFRSLLPDLIQSEDLAKKLISLCVELPHEERRTVTGHLDETRSYAGFGAVSWGWAICNRGDQIWLVSDAGKWRNLEQAIRYNRDDIENVFSENYGPYTSHAGFFCTLQSEDELVTKVKLVAVTETGLFVLHEKDAVKGPLDPVAYAKWTFSLPTPFTRFNDRMEHHDGLLIEHLIKERRRAQPSKLEIWDAGEMPSAPEISVIVPLYGRSDFIEHQLLGFCDDPDFRSGRVELIYIVDDPKMIEGVRAWSASLTKLYKIPFRIVWGGVNRGYSGANNVGISIARGDVIVLLNSDVFSTEHGWCSRMAEVLAQDRGVAAVGARLEYPDGSLQHLGMSFDFAQDWGVWLNKHPRQGSDVPAVQGVPIEVTAATAACLAVRITDLNSIGKMDEGYLIGDFEDSDLCLRLRKAGGRIVVLPDTRLVHLERQSFSLLGEQGFRVSVTRFNAWRHNRRWKDYITKIKAEEAK